MNDKKESQSISCPINKSLHAPRENRQLKPCFIQKGETEFLRNDENKKGKCRH